MAGMILPPEDIGRQREDTDDPPKEVVQPAPFEIGAMPAIMLDYEEPDEEDGRRKNEGQRHPGLAHKPPKERADQGEERQDGTEQIEQTVPAIGLGKGRDQFAPGPILARGAVAGSHRSHRPQTIRYILLPRPRLLPSEPLKSIPWFAADRADGGRRLASAVEAIGARYLGTKCRSA
jgi:hypothetical protein